ncbi:MAG TPA: ATP-binding cassette domain-containing protein [Candidatus Dormibacteraeota bacterium]
MLQLESVTKRYGDLEALHELSLSVQDGEIFGFVGANGAGKTTTMRVVLGVLEADAGTVLWNGTEITFALRRRIGYIPEDRGLYPKMAILAQLTYFARLHGMSRHDARAASTSWLERLGLADRAQSQLQALSHGNQQRVQLAAALVFSPELLVLDEPFAGLDPVAVDAMSDVLRAQANEGRPVVVSSHQLDIVERLCDRVGIINHGQMVATGTVTELTERGPLRFWVDIPAAAPGWYSGIAGVTLVEQDGSRWLLQLADESGEQAVLRAALALGPVHEFRRDRPGLTQLFRDVMTGGAVGE